jgi:predicted nucleic acid-binding protein
MNAHRETLICDTSFVSHFFRLRRWPERYANWNQAAVARVKTAILAVSIVTVAELRAGYLEAGWGSRRIAEMELQWASFLHLLIDDPHLNAWSRLRADARGRGVAIGDNDLWIAATATVRQQTLVTCDLDHIRLAPQLPVEVLYLAPPV